ncbi:myb-like protein H [Pieris napi]|uniref:myb-like protein H n=1 Tax=Pieris napi TaxID=78633 RepID=UPI001FB8B40C|nr:myb-like protein H [Pieris napi]
MAEDDEIDILGDFSFNSCFAQNNQGIPSCSSREDTVHPQWLLDSPATNWYDSKSKNRSKEGPPRKLCGTKSFQKNNCDDAHGVAWSQEERNLLNREMEKHGRNIMLISQKLKSKSITEIQALIDAEYGISLDTSWEKHNNLDHIPYVEQEEIISEEGCISEAINMVTTGSPTITVPKIFRKTSKQQDNYLNSTAHKNSHINQNNNLQITKHMEKIKAVKKVGNHRRKVSKNYDKSISPARLKNNSHSEESLKSPKLQIVLGSGQALPVSEGEQVIKIEKKKDSEPESDIEIDVDSDTEAQPMKSQEAKVSDKKNDNEPIAIPLRKLEMPKRRRKINLNGGGGYRIMHTEAGDLYEISSEPRKERQPRKPTVQLIQCKKYGVDKPAPCELQLHVSVLLSMDIHAHTSRAEVMGLLGGQQVTSGLLLCAYAVARAAANSTHCDMDPVSQASAGEYLTAQGLSVCGWHHSHPQFPALPSKRDLSTQRSLQDALEWRLPFLALVTSPAPAPHFRCFRVEDSEDKETPIGYQLEVKLVPDLTIESLPDYVRGLKQLLKDVERTEHSIDLSKDVCPHTGVGYLDKCIWSVSRHMRTAGYEPDHPVLKQLIQDVRDIFR